MEPSPCMKERRERIATACLAALLSDPDFNLNYEAAANFAMKYADALIEELDRK